MSSSKFIDYSISSKFIKDKAKAIITSILDKFSKINRPLKIMHICGTHEATVSRSGIRSLLPADLRIISGPGCPVCVCPSEHVSTAVKLAEEGNIIATFGDMLKVPDHNLITLNQSKAKGSDIRVVYSVSDAVRYAFENPDKNLIWLGIGFETTAPMTSFVLEKQKLPENFFILTDFRLVPPAMHILCRDPEFDIDGYILPGHVSTIIGTKPYEIFPEQYQIPCVVAGFDAVEFLLALDKTLEQILESDAYVYNAYPKVVKPEGNIAAIDSMKNVFNEVDAKWRGVGIIPKSGFELKEEYSDHNARNLLDNPIVVTNDLPEGCKCGKVILGKVEPEECPHFLRKCTPETAIGPCMVSDEGTCRIRATYINVLPSTN
ncbi:MAG: hydrogenase formation protein HypD [Candidatus Heimdallarchaeota archaeon]|nr:hydrogenase formation protein HypD [Candidatus Heimdallarchaeota archaeon]